MASASRTAAACAVLAAATATAACTGERADDGPAAVSAGPVADVRPVSLPAGPGSGQPRFAEGPDGTLVLSWLRRDGEGHELVFAEQGPDGWSGPRQVARGTHFFVNWADFPSVVPLGGGALAAHWLEKTGESPYAYGVRIALSGDGGRSWSRPVTPHADRSPTEHGFVSLLPARGGGVRAVWLDGRKFPSGAEAGGRGSPSGGGNDGSDGAPAGEGDGSGEAPPEAPEMTLRSAVVRPGGEVGERALLDGRTCDCCQTSAAATSRGPLVVYRDRSGEEIRDIRAVRLEEDGWGPPRSVHDDGWKLEACPVNGPAVAARGDTAVVAWFTGAEGRPRVRAAFSVDAGASFGEPVSVDDGDPVGRVDVALLPGGDALVSWMERGADGAEAGVRVRRVTAGGSRGAATSLATTSAGRAAGFPRLAVRGGRVMLAWTDPAGESRVRVVEGRLRTP